MLLIAGLTNALLNPDKKLENGEGNTLSIIKEMYKQYTTIARAR